MTVKNTEDLFNRYKQGDRLALSRLITRIENHDESYDVIMRAVYPCQNGVPRIGITGPPGVGKSSLVTEIVKELRKKQASIGIIAIDPSSPFTGGALLGDRIRMNRIGSDAGVFIRSLATRGSLGGLAVAAEDVADLMDGFGCDVIIIETVGVGQAELDIIKTADVTLVTLSPESGDSIQAMKAGLMEIGNIFVLNKCDRDGADRAYVEIESALSHRPKTDWEPPIIKTSANTCEGIETLVNAIEKYLEFLKHRGKLKERNIHRRQSSIEKIVNSQLLSEYWTDDRKEFLDELAKDDISVIDAAKKIYR